MYYYIKCPTCNNSIGEYKELFNFLKEKKFKELKTKTSIHNYQYDENLQISFDDIYDDLNLKKICCRKNISMYIEFTDLYNIDT
jgi:DNA-directed RNA polymerase subunit N (RpoN/RPB10)